MTTSQPRKTIAVDVDDVLANSAAGFVAFSNQRWGTRLKPDDYDERWAVMWGVDHEEEKRRAHHIYQNGVVADFNQFEAAHPVLTQLAQHYKLVITTSRARHLQQDTYDWLDRHFNGLFSEIHLAGFYDNLTPDSHKLTKAELCRSIGADYLIDDHPKHCLAAAEAGIPALLFGDYKWNRHLKPDNLPKNVARVHSWEEIGAYFARLG